MKDITEQEQLREANTASHLELESIYHHSPFWVAYIDTQLQILKLNPLMEQLISRTTAEVMGRYCYDIWGQYAEDETRKGKERVCDNCKVQKTMQDGRKHTHERKLGDRYFEITSSPVKDDNGEITGALEVAVEITDRKEFQDRLVLEGEILAKAQQIAHVGSWHLDTKQNILTWSDEAYRIFGLTPQEFKPTYESFLNTIHPDDRDIVNNTYKRAIENNQPYEIIHRIVRPDGEVRIVHEKSEDIVDQNGNTIHSIGMVHDITHQERMVLDLLEHEAEYNHLFNNLGDAAFVADMQGNFLAVNEVAEHHLSYSKTELLHMGIKDIHPPQPADAIKERLTLIKKRGALQFETEHITRDGSIVPVEINSRFISHKGQPAFLALARDISERKQAEQTIKESEYLFRHLFDNMSSGVAIYEAVKEGECFIFRDINQAGLASCQMKKKDVLGKKVREVFPGVVDLGLFEVLQRVWQTGKPEHHPSSLYKDNRVMMWVENYVFKLPTGEVVAVYDDISERKQAEDALLHTTERLQFLLRSTPTTIYTCKPSGDYPATFISENVKKQTGYEPQELLDDPGFLLAHLHPEDISRIVAELPRLFKNDFIIMNIAFRQRMAIMYGCMMK